MSKISLYFSTNRKHKGKDQWHPIRYGNKYSSNGRQNLRFGSLQLTVDDKIINNYLIKKSNNRIGDGEGLAKYLTKLAKSKKNIKIESLKENITEASNFDNLTSTQTFRALKFEMENSSDVCVFIHGYNVDWEEAVGSALALQCSLNQKKNYSGDINKKKIIVFLFSWPSEGSMMPFAAYWSDRKSAVGSGPAVGRAFLKLMKYFEKLYEQVKSDNNLLCKQKINLLCHSMGNYVLENALQTIIEYSNSQRLPRLFNHIFLCAPDVDDDVLESDKPLGRLHQFCQTLSVYYNQGDIAMHIADKTKGNPDRLGQSGIANELTVHKKIHQIDCSYIVGGIVEHSYYLWATVINDISMSVHDVDMYDERRKRFLTERNSWKMT